MGFNMWNARQKQEGMIWWTMKTAELASSSTRFASAKFQKGLLVCEWVTVSGTHRPDLWDTSEAGNPQCAFRLLWAAVWAEMNIFIMLNFPPCKLKHKVGVFAENLRVKEVGLKQPTRAWKHIGGSSFWECLKWSWWTRMFYGINLLSILDLKQLRKLNLFKNWDFAIVFLLTFSLIGPV